MPIASEIEPVAPGIFLWRVFDPAVKADLFSTAITTTNGSYLIDPVALTPEAAAELHERGPIGGIIVTNENHARAAANFAETFKVPIHGHPASVTGTGLLKVEPVEDRRLFASELTAIEIDGGPIGEIAIHSSGDEGSMIVGDALINFDRYGFTFLPPKYCSNAKTMRRSLSKLLDYDFERILFAHGTPILTGARDRLEELLHRR
jgi:glyoxylase-like metal-dependent hydrolase (beta-lactamase superfamily II)